MWVVDLPCPRSESNGWDSLSLHDEVTVVDVTRGVGRERCTTAGRRDPLAVIWVIGGEMIEGLSAHRWRTWWLDKTLTARLLTLNKPSNQTACCDAKRSGADRSSHLLALEIFLIPALVAQRKDKGHWSGSSTIWIQRRRSFFAQRRDIYRWWRMEMWEDGMVHSISPDDEGVGPVGTEGWRFGAGA